MTSAPEKSRQVLLELKPANLCYSLVSPTQQKILIWHFKYFSPRSLLNHYKFGNSSSNKLINEVLKRGSECDGTDNANVNFLQRKSTVQLLYSFQAMELLMV